MQQVCACRHHALFRKKVRGKLKKLQGHDLLSSVTMKIYLMHLTRDERKKNNQIDNNGADDRMY